MMAGKIPTVAIITRTKDRELFLDRAIKDIMAQTYEDFVVVIVNDGGQLEPVERLAKKHKKIIKNRLKIIHNKTPLGMQAASNIGVTKSQSKYLVIHDDDDTWHPEFLAETVAFLENSKYKGVATASEIVNEIVIDNKVKITGRGAFEEHVKQIDYFSLSGGNLFPTHAFLYARAVIDKIGLYSEEASVLGDWDFNLRFLKAFDIGFIDRPLAYYHHRQGLTGDIGNSAFDKADSHAVALSYLLNKYLRDDLRHGALGEGFIANVSHHLNKNALTVMKAQAQIIEELRQVKVLNEKNNRELNQRLTNIEQKVTRIDDFNQKLLPRLRKYFRGAPSYINRKLIRRMTSGKHK